LARSVLAAAEEHSALPEAVRETRDDLSAALDGLVEAAMQKLPGAAVDHGPRAKDVDTRLDAAWSGTYNWLAGWARLPNEPKAKIAAELRERLFPEGLRFTQLRYPQQWAESNTRLSLIDQDELDKTFETLGGRSFLDALRETHKAYGEVLGITKPQEEEVRATRIRDALSRLSDALRAYVLQVSAMERKSDPNSSKLVEQLLKPLANWQSPTTSSPSAPKPAAEAPKPDPDSQAGHGTC